MAKYGVYDHEHPEPVDVPAPVAGRAPYPPAAPARGALSPPTDPEPSAEAEGVTA